MADLARALADEPAVKWLIGRVKEVTGATFTMSYRGGDVPDVGTLDSYVPVVGDVVHVLSSNTNGMIAIGSNNQTTTPPPDSLPGAPVTVAASGVATYLISSTGWTADLLAEGPDQIGCWFYPSFAAASVPGVLPVSRLTINVTAQDATPLEFVLHASTDTSGPLVPVPGSSYRAAAPIPGVATDIPLPLEWASMLVLGQAKGVGVGGGGYTAVLTGSSGLLTFTPLL